MLRLISGGLLAVTLLVSGPLAGAENGQPPQTQLLWGDTHLHTNNSFDAFLNGNFSVTPSDAYRFAKGEPVIHAYTRSRVQLGTPLDFLVITDHAEFLGGVKDMYNDRFEAEDAGPIARLLLWWRERQIREAVDSGNGRDYFNEVLPMAGGDPRELAATWNDDVAAPIPGPAAGGAGSELRPYTLLIPLRTPRGNGHLASCTGNPGRSAPTSSPWGSSRHGRVRGEGADRAPRGGSRCPSGAAGIPLPG